MSEKAADVQQKTNKKRPLEILKKYSISQKSGYYNINKWKCSFLFHRFYFYDEYIEYYIYHGNAF